MSKEQIVRYLVLRSVGNFLLLFAIFGAVFTFGPTVYYEISYRVGKARGVEYVVEAPQTTGFGEILAKERDRSQQPLVGFAKFLTGPKEQILTAKDPNFSILIPKIGASSLVIPNVDGSDEKSYLPALQRGVAHAQGTVLPGLPGNIYLFAHSTDSWWNVGRYNAIFYLIKELNAGDEIVVFFNNQRYNYVVTGSSVVDSDDVSHITNAKTGVEQLILQTCWPPGTTWKRLLVFAKPL